MPRRKTKKTNSNNNKSNRQGDDTNYQQKRKLNDDSSSSDLPPEKKRKRRHSVSSLNSSSSTTSTTTTTRQSTEQPIEERWTLLAIKTNFIYFPSPNGYDHPDLFEVLPVDLLRSDDPAKSEKSGYGLFAKNLIPYTANGQNIIGEYTGELLDALNEQSGYSMIIKKGPRWLDAEKKGNYVRFANHSDQANCEFTRLPGTEIVVLCALREIQPGEQLLVNYGVENLSNNKLFFLNPDDSNLSATQYIYKHNSKYQLKEVTAKYPALNLNKNEKIYMSEIGAAIFASKNLAKQKFSVEDLAAINTRFIKTVNDQAIDFKKSDTLYAVMLAAYRGQIDNLKWLIEHNADIDIQQTISGRSALFFAVEGFKDNQFDAKRCMAIILFLIQKKANLCLQDTKNELFLYSAIQYLSGDDVDSIFKVLNKKTIKELLMFTDDNDDDLFLFAIKNKHFDTVNILLKYYPNYLDKYIGEDQEYYGPTDISDLINSFNNDEKIELKNIFITHNVSKSITEEIFIEQKVNIDEKLKKTKATNHKSRLFDHDDSKQTEMKDQTIKPRPRTRSSSKMY